MSSPWPAMPMTSVPKMIGTMIDLIIRRKMVESGLRLYARLGFSQPIRTPTTMEMRIHRVSDMPRSDLHSHFIGWPACPP